MAKTITLKPVTRRNWEAVVDLKVAPDQRGLVASNAYSLAESKFDSAAQPRAIYAGKRLVGFLMYDISGAKKKAFIYRFMIDHRRQGQGYGHAAFAAALKEIGKIAGVKKISVCYMAGNRVARMFYSGFGFREVGRDTDGEMVAELKL
jgi:diamine N-acetyltransferase